MTEAELKSQLKIVSFVLNASLLSTFLTISFDVFLLKTARSNGLIPEV
jgi:hypothetical protein